MSEALIRVIADGAVVPVVLIGAYMLWFGVPKVDKFAVYSKILMAGLSSYLIARLVGNIYQPSLERPFEVLGVSPGASFLDNPGFPSDHSLFVMAIALAVWFATKNKPVSIVLFLLVAVVSVGRVLALVHTTYDVVFGVIIACVGALWYVNGSTLSTKKQKS